MKPLRIILLSLFLLPTLCLSAVAQSTGSQHSDQSSPFVYRVDLLSYFDNREYDADFQCSQTLFATRLSPEIGLQFKDAYQQTHRLMLGAHYTKAMGRPFEKRDFVPTVYYEYQHPNKDFKFFLGSVPYAHLSQDLPSYVLYDSIVYVHPNIQGALMQYQNDHAFFDLMCDWRSMQGENRREAFRLLMHGMYDWGLFHAGGLIQMNHLASKKFQKNGVCDDAFINPQVGIRLPLLNEFRLTAGYLWAYQWDRIHASQPTLSQSILLDFQASWNRIGLKNLLYVGQNLQPLYLRNGMDLYLGDSFYQSSCYNRCDIYVYLLQNNIVNCLISWNLHYTKEFGLDHQQQLICRFSTDGLKQNRVLKNLFGK